MTTTATFDVPTIEHVSGAPIATDSSHVEMWAAVLARDPSRDGDFVFAVSSTGIYCRPSCPAKHARRSNVSFFHTTDEAENAGHRACLRCKPKAAGGNPNLRLAKAICRYIEQHLDEPVTLSALSRAFKLSPFHLQRCFKAAIGVSPKAYAESCRMKLLKSNLQKGHSVTRAMYDAGYSSSSRLYERTARHLGMSPDKYRRGSIATVIRYSTTESPLGRMLIAATDKGVCAIHFADSDDELEQGLKHEFPFAVRRRDEEALQVWTQDLLNHLAGQPLNSSLPLDIQATAFQHRVWTYLQSIPIGETRSYSQAAKDLGHPTAARAVARACATNRIAVAIPCHRIIRESGDVSGYRWGIPRKQQLLELEKKASITTR